MLHTRLHKDPDNIRSRTSITMHAGPASPDQSLDDGRNDMVAHHYIENSAAPGWMADNDYRVAECLKTRKPSGCMVKPDAVRFVAGEWSGR